MKNKNQNNYKRLTFLTQFFLTLTLTLSSANTLIAQKPQDADRLYQQNLQDNIAHYNSLVTHSPIATSKLDDKNQYSNLFQQIANLKKFIAHQDELTDSLSALADNIDIFNLKTSTPLRTLRDSASHIADTTRPLRENLVDLEQEYQQYAKEGILEEDFDFRANKPYLLDEDLLAQGIDTHPLDINVNPILVAQRLNDFNAIFTGQMAPSIQSFDQLTNALLGETSPQDSMFGSPPPFQGNLIASSYHYQDTKHAVFIDIAQVTTPNPDNESVPLPP